MSFEEKVLKKFESLDAQQEKVLKKFESLDAQQEKVLKKFESLDARFQSFDARLGSFDTQQEKVLKKLEKLDRLEKTVHDRILPKLLDLDAYVHEEVATKHELRAVKEELVDHIDFLARRSETHEQERIAGVQRMDRIEKRVTKLERKVGEA